MQIYNVYLSIGGTHGYIHREQQLSYSFVQGIWASLTNKLRGVHLNSHAIKCRSFKFSLKLFKKTGSL